MHAAFQFGGDARRDVFVILMDALHRGYRPGDYEVGNNIAPVESSPCCRGVFVDRSTQTADTCGSAGPARSEFERLEKAIQVHL